MALDGNVSASQIKVAELCLRKWWFSYVAQVREKRKGHFVLGEILHAVGERFLLGQARNEEDLYPKDWATAIEPEEALWVRRVVRQAIEKNVWQLLTNAYVEFPVLFLTAPHHVDARGLPLMAMPNVYMEKDIRRHGRPSHLFDGRELPADWAASRPFIGFIDLLTLGAEPWVIDHKTSKSRKYATTPGKLAKDSQVRSYAAAPLVLNPAAADVRMRHNIFLKAEAPVQAYAVDAMCTLNDALEQWASNRLLLQQMESMRVHYPKVKGPDPFKRAQHWMKVPSAMDRGQTREACDAFGGCPFREVCTGRCPVDRVVMQLDAPAGPGLTEVSDGGKGVNPFRLNLGPTPPRATSLLMGGPPPPPPPSLMPAPLPPPPPPQESPMFAAPALAVGTDVFVIDPHKTTQQYRARITAIEADGISIALWPNHEVQPLFDQTLAQNFRTKVPEAALMTVPSVAQAIVGYESELVAHNVAPAERAWTPAPPPGPIASAEDAKAPSKPPRDGRFSIAGTPPAAATGALAATPPAPSKSAVIAANAPANGPDVNFSVPPVNPALPPPVPGFVPAVPGGVVRVAANVGHSFWGPLKGKLATVANVTHGELPGTFVYHVSIEGADYPDVDARRFEPVPAAAPALDPTWRVDQRAWALRGQVAAVKHLRAGADKPNSYNGVLEEVDASGITMMGGQVKLPWSEVVSVDPLTEQSIPGIELPKGAGKKLDTLQVDTAKAIVKRAKEADKAAKEAAKAAAGGTPAAPAAPAADPATPAHVLQAQATPTGAEHLSASIDTVKAALAAGKVTKKVLEGILPALISAQEYQTHLLTQLMTIGAGSDATSLSEDEEELYTIVDQLLAHRAKMLQNA
jgi:hypothetical protein